MQPSDVLQKGWAWILSYSFGPVETCWAWLETCGEPSSLKACSKHRAGRPQHSLKLPCRSSQPLPQQLLHGNCGPTCCPFWLVWSWDSVQQELPIALNHMLFWQREWLLILQGFWEDTNKPDVGNETHLSMGDKGSFSVIPDKIWDTWAAKETTMSKWPFVRSPLLRLLGIAPRCKDVTVSKFSGGRVSSGY